jgi:hypothetical protein
MRFVHAASCAFALSETPMTLETLVEAADASPRSVTRTSQLAVAAMCDPRQNRLLAALPDTEWARWVPHLELVDMPLGKVLYESGRKLSHV